ncbi:ceramide glucosyltransferase [Plakobranchus ocellatus]|uniref:Ceramide glucosyltransferase n=1 Tax=Plakobranchus ocellatus TaxID=259542 RepID=A0AAV4B0J1_9GAST|nr:ceramide glucosyltransferase [Plakobranchus ocellatus]
MMTAVTGILEPLSDCFPLGIWTGWALYHFFSINPFIFFGFHVLSWLVLDYIQLRTVQNGQLLFSKAEYVIAWIVRELTSTYVFILAVLNPHHIKWGRNTYKVKMGGLVELVQEKSKLQSL